MALALSLTVAIPLAAAPSGKQKADEEKLEKQYSMSEGRDQQMSDSDNSGNPSSDMSQEELEKQYSMVADTKDPKKGETYSNLEHDRSDSSKSSERRHLGMERSSSLNQPEAQDIEKWRGMKVVSANGEKVGEIDELILDLDSGEVSHAIIDNAGFAKGKSAVVISQLQRDDTKKRLILSEGSAEKSVDGSRTSSKIGDSGSESRLTGNLVECKDLIGESVANTNGEKIGEIEKLVQAPDSSVVYAVLGDLSESTAMEAKDAKQVAVRLDELKRSSDGFQINVMESSFKAAPSVALGSKESWKQIGSNERFLVIQKNKSFASASY